VWVTNGINDTVSKLRASDGKNLGNFSVGLGPIGVAFDGADIWVANRNNDTVSKLRASDGKTLGTFSTPGGPYGVAFDGTNIWVSGETYVFELRRSDTTQLVQLPTTGAAGIAFDGANIWVGEPNDNVAGKF